ncbi:14 kDa zinc-binding protein-like [Silene latifolia]|uniref:14 kDa zinc-binding protein-like n=1 Tax=Silene latifolia TaxID=37657 RepID=UPI003D785767
MSAILFPARLCQNPIRAGFFLGRLGSSAYSILPSLTWFVNVQDPTSTRIASWESGSTSSNARTLHYVHCMRSEKEAALAAASTPPDSLTIFDKIINKEIPANVVYEDDQVLGFRDINPQAPIHILIIPKIKDGLSGLSKAEERHFEILGRLLYTAKLVAKQEGLEDGFRVVINDGPKGCQSVYHIHVHLLGGRQMEWPAG